MTQQGAAPEPTDTRRAARLGTSAVSVALRPRESATVLRHAAAEITVLRRALAIMLLAGKARTGKVAVTIDPRDLLATASALIKTFDSRVDASLE